MVYRYDLRKPGQNMCVEQELYRHIAMMVFWYTPPSLTVDQCKEMVLNLHSEESYEWWHGLARYLDMTAMPVNEFKKFKKNSINLAFAP